MPDELPEDLGRAARLGGETGALFASFDWHAHPLGPPASWPSEWRSHVATALASRFPIVLWLGPDLCLVYNDGYLPALGDKHPLSFGAPGREVWWEIWPIVGPMLQGVVDSGVATWSDDLMLPLVTDGRPYERYFTFTYSPIVSSDGTVSGVFCAVHETTERVLGERRLLALNHITAATANATSGETALAAAIDACAELPADLPFVAAYLRNPSEGAELRAATPWVAPLLEQWAPSIGAWHAPPGATEGAPGSSGGNSQISIPQGEWLVEDLTHRLPRVATGAPAVPERALVLPLGDPSPDSSRGWLVVGLSPLRHLDDQYRGFCRLLADQVEAGVARAEAYEEERRRAEALAELDAAKTAFFTNVSHELRTPLTLILGPVDDALADREEPLPAGQRERMGLVARNASRLLGLVNTLLEFSRLQAGGTVARFVPVDLASETADTASMFRSAVEKAGLRFVVETPPLGEAVYVDTAMWARVVVNLISNALKYTFEGQIEVHLRRAGGSVELSVSDTGVGIPVEEQARLFERFHRVPGVRSRSHEGSGIGLALVAELIEAHKGSVGVESTPGAGSRFWARVPLGRAHLPPDAVHAATDHRAARAATAAVLAEAHRWADEAATAASGGGDVGAETTPAKLHGPERPRVLVVDDNADMRTYLARLLAPLYDIELAVDGADALRKATSRRPDLVLSDVMMPNLDGFELLRALRADPETGQIPIVFVSARAGEEGVTTGLDAGADDYVAKPFSAAELLARVRANLDLDRMRRAQRHLERNRDLLDQAQRLAHVGSFEVDLAAGTLTGSPEFLRLAGRSAEEFGTMSLEEALREVVHPDDEPRVRAILERAVRHHEPVEYEVRLTPPGGPSRLALVRAEVLVGADGRPTALRGSMQDITAQRRAEEETAAAVASREVAVREHRIAEQLQAALLPKADLAPTGLEVATYYQAGTEGTHVGGDWYDLIDLGGGRTALVVGDVMGRGVQAAAIMGQLRSALRAFSRLGLAPNEVLEAMDGVVRDLDEDQIVTCIYAVYDPVERLLTWANAGHPPPLLHTPGRGPAKRLSAGGPPLGSGSGAFSEHQIALPADCTLAFYTDGLVERRNRSVDEGIDALAQQLSELTGHLNPGPARLVDALLPHQADDDVAILLARVPDQEREIPARTWEIPSLTSAASTVRHGAEEFLADWSVSKDVVDNAVLALSELTANAITHGEPPLRVRVQITDTELLVEVRDAALAKPRRLRPDNDDEHGRGLLLVSALADRWGTRSLPDGKLVWATFPCVPGGIAGGNR